MAGVVSRYHEGVQQAKTELILNAIKQTNGNYAQAAKLLGLNPTYLHRLARMMDVKSDGVRGPNQYGSVYLIRYCRSARLYPSEACEIDAYEY